MGIFSKRMNKYGAICGMLSGLIFTATYIIFFKFISPEYNISEYWLFGISPEGIGVIGMIINFIIAIIISSISKPPPIEVYEIVDNIRMPGGK
jgi:cation/acetate symporter